MMENRKVRNTSNSINDGRSNSILSSGISDVICDVVDKLLKSEVVHLHGNVKVRVSRITKLIAEAIRRAAGLGNRKVSIGSIIAVIASRRREQLVKAIDRDLSKVLKYVEKPAIERAYQEVVKVPRDHVEVLVNTNEKWQELLRVTLRDLVHGMGYYITKILQGVNLCQAWIIAYEKLCEARNAAIKMLDTVGELDVADWFKLLVKQYVDRELEFINVLLSYENQFKNYFRNIFNLVRAGIIAPTRRVEVPLFPVSEYGLKVQVLVIKCRLCAHSIETYDVEGVDEGYEIYLSEDIPLTSWRALLEHFRKHGVDLCAEKLDDKIAQWADRILTVKRQCTSDATLCIDVLRSLVEELVARGELEVEEGELIRIGHRVFKRKRYVCKQCKLREEAGEKVKDRYIFLDNDHDLIELVRHYIAHLRHEREHWKDMKYIADREEREEKDKDRS